MKKVAIASLLFGVLLFCQTASSVAQQSAPITVGILALDGPFITETAGALDVYHHVDPKLINVVLISDTDQEMKTYEGMPFRANYTIENAPKLDVLVVPSGVGSLERDLKNQKVIAWVKEAAAQAKYVTSHCQGAFLLGAAGLLDGKNVTTFPTNRTDLQKQFPKAKVTEDRVVVDGNFISSAGGLATYEGSLWVVGQMFGQQEAKRIGDALVFGPSNVTVVNSPAVHE